MNDKLQEDKLEDASQEGIIKKLIETDLLVAAEVFGASMDEESRTVVDTSTCSEKDFMQKVLKIAEISGDKLLAENAKQKISHPDLKYALSPATLSVLEIYSERFYSFWENGELITIKSEISDFPQWYNTARDKAAETLTAEEMENILVMCCAKEPAQKAPLLRKLLDNVINSETIRLGFLYPDRDMANGILADFFQKLNDLLLIREQHDSSLQLGEHPEDLIPYVWANIIKNLLNQQYNEALDNINALAYLLYAAEKTESITGTAAYAELKKGLFLFDEGKQCTWPNELRKMFLDPTMVEALMRYRFTHGLIAVNTALSYRYAEKKDNTYLNPSDEDAIVLNGLLLTPTGYIRSSGFKDTPIREQFIRNVDYFKNLKKVFERRTLGKYFLWRKDMKSTCESLEKQLRLDLSRIDGILKQKGENITLKENRMIRSETKTERENTSFLQKLRRGTPTERHLDEPEILIDEIEKDKKDLEDLLGIRKTHEEAASLINKLTGFFT